MLILAIESSCDEFSVAIVRDGIDCLMMETLSQIASHAKYGGVIPELASREHVRDFAHILKKVLLYSESISEKFDAIAVTVGPGLSGSLLVGIQVAKTLATYWNLPLIPVHHILGHIFSVGLTHTISYPLMSLIVSGGHTEIVYSTSSTEHKLIGKTRDDAVGEVYDKIARKLNMPYPGGPLLDKIAQSGECRYQFKKPRMDDRYAFSFSGLKSAVINQIRKETFSEDDVADLACSFQTTVVDELLTKLKEALSEFPAECVLLCGGVSANAQLRAAFLDLEKTDAKTEYLIPDFKYCGDNAAMIGGAAYYLKAVSYDETLTLDCTPNITIEDFLKKFNEVKE